MSMNNETTAEEWLTINSISARVIERTTTVRHFLAMSINCMAAE